MRCLPAHRRVKAAVPLALLLLLSGCLGHASTGKATSPSGAPHGPAADGLAVRLDHAKATYQLHDDLGHANETRFSFAAQDIWSAAFDRVPGVVVDLAERAMLVDPISGDVLTDDAKDERLGLDRCGTPVWEWCGGDSGRGAAEFFDRGSALPLRWIESVAVLQRGDLPALDAQGRKELDASGLPVGEAAVPERLQAAREHGDRFLHVAAERGVWLALWANDADPLVQAGDWRDAVRMEWPASQPFPSTVWNGTETWVLQGSSNEGARMPDCFPGRAAARIAWGPWGPDVDPPLPISWQALVNYVRHDPTELVLQQYQADHPDAYLSSLIVDPSYEDGLPNIPGVLENPGDRWDLFVGAPGVKEGPIIDCLVFDGGPERPDSYLCNDRAGTWQTNVSLPTVHWSAVHAHDLQPWFAFLDRYGYTADWLVFILDWPDVGNDRPVSVNLATANAYHTQDFHYIGWDPQGPDSYAVIGFTWDEFGHPPG